MVTLLTATDLEEWSGRRDAQAHLPTLIRRLLMATVAPGDIRMAAAEGISSPGFDGVVEVGGGAPPYVPAGRSVWEMGTGQKPERKAVADYDKRTRDTPDTERATLTFVFVTSRSWAGAREWARAKAGSSDGWAGVLALDAQDLATWLAMCPGVHGWLASDHLGRQPFGVTALRDWFADWSERTEPSIPPDLLLCGSTKNAVKLMEVLDGHPRDYVIATRSRDEAVAFIAAALLVPGDRQVGNEVDSSQEIARQQTRRAEEAAEGLEDADDLRTEAEGEGGEAQRDRDDAAHREALIERAVVVSDGAAWRRWMAHEASLILIPLFDEPTIDAAVRAGHHVLLPRVARPGDSALPPLHRGDARQVWERAGVGFPRADDLARAARRSLTSLRRRIGRTGRFRRPAWADGTSANLLAPLLLAGAWADDVEGDREVVTALADRGSWRSVARDLAPLTSGDDAPLVERQHHWEFVDIVDAWDALSPALTSEDLHVFHESVRTVLGEPDPTLALSPEERRKAALSIEGLPRRRCSGLLRQGVANTLALLGAVAEDRILPGGRTGEEHAARAVRELLTDASRERWMSLSELLPVLAEAAPDAFLDAVEASLRGDCSIMSLFDEQKDPFAVSSSSRHTSLLWALEALAFSPRHLSRVAVLLAQLAERDPGGRLANRPAQSLNEILHLIFPQSAVSNITRLQVVDAVRRATREMGWKLLIALIRTIDQGILVRHGPRFRDWPRSSLRPLTYAAIADPMNEIGFRLADDAGTDVERWESAVGLVDKVPPSARQRMLDTLNVCWSALDIEAQRRVVKVLDRQVNRHACHRDEPWALDDHSLEQLRQFLAGHSVPGIQPADHALFSWRPQRAGMENQTDPGRAALAEAREEAVRRTLAAGFDSLIALAEASEVPETVGVALAAVTDEFDDRVLDLLGSGTSSISRVAHALASTRRSSDPEWLGRMVRSRPHQAVALLLTVDVDDALLQLLGELPPSGQSDFWRRVEPWRVPDDLIVTVCEQLLAHGRAVSVLDVLGHADKGAFPTAIAIDALRAAATGSEERLDSIPSPTYVIGQVLDRVEDAGVTTDVLAQLEWLYAPILHDERSFTALNRSLASDPRLFAELVSLVYKRDPSEEDEVPDNADELEEVATEESEPPVAPHVSEAAWHVLREWRTPLPGSLDGSVPNSEQMQDWVTAARQALKDRRRSRIASLAIGEALSGPTTDAGGTWPSRPVRDVLENERDSRLERELVIGRVNQRGVTVRGPYDGGEKEWKLARQYREWADKVRHDQPRAGAVLDDLARIYEADARREDTSAAVQSEM